MAGPRRRRRPLALLLVVVLGGAVCGRLQLRGQDVEHHLHVPVATGLHILVKLQYAAAAACREDKDLVVTVMVMVMDHPFTPTLKGRG